MPRMSTDTAPATAECAAQWLGSPLSGAERREQFLLGSAEPERARRGSELVRFLAIDDARFRVCQQRRRECAHGRPRVVDVIEVDRGVLERAERSIKHCFGEGTDQVATPGR